MKTVSFGFMAAACAAVLTIAGAAPATAAEPGFYASAGYANFDVEGADLGAIGGRFGYDFNSHVAVEGEAARGVHEDSGSKLDDSWGVYGVAKTPIGANFDVFARLGYQGARIKNGAAALDDDGLGYGVGAQWNVSDRFGVRADYTRLDLDHDVDTIGLSGVVKF